MMFRIDRDVLAEAVAWTARSLPARPSMPVLAGMRLEVTDDQRLKLSGFDYEVSAEVTLELQTGEQGWCSSPANSSPRSLGRCPPSRSSSPWTVPRRSSPAAARGSPCPPCLWRTIPRCPPCRRRPVGSAATCSLGSRPGRRRHGQGRHASDAHGRADGDRERHRDPGGHRPLPPGRTRAEVAAGAARSPGDRDDPRPYARRDRQALGAPAPRWRSRSAPSAAPARA